VIDFYGIFLKRVVKIKNDIMELKVKSQRKHYRLLFIFTGQKIVFLHACIKKTKKLNPNDIKIAERRKKEYLKRR